MNFAEFEACTDRTWSLTGRESKLNAALVLGAEAGEIMEPSQTKCFPNKRADPEELKREGGEVS